MLLRFILKITVVFAALMALSFLLVSCSEDAKNDITEEAVSSTATTEITTTAKVTDTTTTTAVQTSVLTTADSTTETQQTDVYVENNDSEFRIDTYVILNNESTTIKGDGAAFENGVLTISKGGTYFLQGTLSNGKIYVNSPEGKKKVKLILNGVSVACSTDAPLFIENSPKHAVLFLADGSVNSFSDTKREKPSDEKADYATATIYSKDDLHIEGKGTLNVNANFNKGIFSKNTVNIKDGTININSIDDGIRGKEKVKIEGGTINITAGGDGIRTNKTTEAGKGSIDISGGMISVYSELDCIQSVVDINISGGTFTLVSSGGSTGVSYSSDEENRHNRDDSNIFDFFSDSEQRAPHSVDYYDNLSQDAPSQKGIKADGKISISGGSFNISSTDDCIHAPELDILGGNFSLASDDDGIHADNTVNIHDANIKISYSYEGIEGTVVNIKGGKIHLVSTDDGFNAAGNNTASGAMGGRSGMHPMAADYSCVVNISGGYVFINASGDGVDSNGNVNQTGGTLIVFGPTNNGSSALDYGGTYKISGGTLLATGSAGMAQSVSGDGIDVLAFNYSGQANVLNAIVDGNGNSLIGFNSPKPFGIVIFASDKLEHGKSYDLYSGGSYDTQNKSGVYLDGKYSPGTLIGTLYPS